MMRDDYKSAENRKKQSYWANKLSTAKHKRIIHFMITGETEDMRCYKRWSNIMKERSLYFNSRITDKLNNYWENQ